MVQTLSYTARKEALITPTASNRAFGHKLFDLSSLLELLGSDGGKPVVKRIRIHFGIQILDGNGVFITKLTKIHPCIVQTNGTFTDTVDIDESNLRAVFDQCINDEFGYQKVGDSFSLNLQTYADDATNGYSSHHKAQRTFVVPQNVIQLLNKEVSTERLQSLLFSIAGFHSTVDVNFGIRSQSFIEIEYIQKVKGITIR